MCFLEGPENSIDGNIYACIIAVLLVSIIDATALADG